MSNCEEIRTKNLSINEKFRKLIEVMKNNNIKTFEQNGKIDENIKNILQLELNKCIKLYCFELNFELPREDVTIHEATLEDGKINLRPELNARGDTDGITVYPGLQHALDIILPSPNIGLLGKKLDDGKIHAVQVFGKDINETQLSGKKYISSNRDQLDYFAELLETGKIDLDFILDVFPHEAMHVFIPGQGVWIEGTTERLAREVSDKYGLRLTPTSHSKETAIISRIEAIVGREAISSIALTNEQKDLRNTNKDLVDNLRNELLKSKIDDKIGTGTFDKLKKVLDEEYREFLNYRTKPNEFQLYRNKSFSSIIEFLDKWIKSNPYKLQVPYHNTDLTDEQKLEILEIQDKESDMLDNLLIKCQSKDLRDEIKER